MKTLHYRWNRSLNWILTTLLGFLGFSSCEDNGDDPGNIICMYGTPTASYTIKGKVTDQAGQALSDIQIIVSDMEFSYEPRPDFIPDTPYGSHPVNDTLYSGKEGEQIGEIYNLVFRVGQRSFKHHLDIVDGHVRPQTLLLADFHRLNNFF